MTSPAAGWYPDPSGAIGQRYFDGLNWTEDYAREMSSAQRSARLDEVVDQWMAHGGQVESRTPFQAAMLFGSDSNNLIHLIMTLVTCGFWIIVWIIVASSNSRVQRRILKVDQFGIVRELDVFGKEIDELSDPNQ